MPRRKKKVEAPQVFRPEPLDADETESRMLWDKVSESKRPNELHPPGFSQLYNNGTKSFPAGPPTRPPAPPASAGGASFAPLSENASPKAASMAGKQQQQQEASPSALPPPVSEKGSSPGTENPQTAKSATQSNVGGPGASSSPAQHQPHSFLHHSPQTIQRHQGIMTRAELLVLEAERKVKQAQEDLHNQLDHTDDLCGALSAYRKEFNKANRELTEATDGLEQRRKAESSSHETQLQEQQQTFEQLRLQKDDKIEILLQTREKDVTTLEDKRATQEAIRAAHEQYEALKDQHIKHKKEVREQLEEKQNRLEDIMKKKLQRTINEMDALTKKQNSARKERAEQEFVRLSDELANYERESKVLNSKCANLTRLTDGFTRDVVLETERKDLLMQKNAKLSREIQELVSSLEQLEKQFSEQASNTHKPQQQGTSQMAAIVDQQYEVILQLKRDLVEVRGDIGDAEAELIKRRRNLMNLDADQPPSSSSQLGDHLPIQASGRSKMVPQPPSGQSSSRNRNAIADTPRTSSSSSSTALILKQQQPSNGALTARSGPKPQSEVALGASDKHALIREALLEAVNDIDKGIRSMSAGGKTLDDVSDPAERLKLLDYMVRRVNFASNLGPQIVKRPMAAESQPRQRQPDLAQTQGQPHQSRGLGGQGRKALGLLTAPPGAAL